MEEVDKYLSLFPRDETIRVVVDLYGHVFLFLSSVMDWIMKKRARRLLDSFKENFNDAFHDELTRINDKVARIRHLASPNAMAEGRVTRLLVEALKRDMRLGREGSLRHQAEMQLAFERLETRLSKADEDRRLQDERMKHLGGSVVEFLEAYATKWLEAGKYIAAPNFSSAPSSQAIPMIMAPDRSIEHKGWSYFAWISDLLAD